MSTVSTSVERAGVGWLRCPGERWAFVVCALSNLLVVAVAVAVVLAGANWLATHPALAKHVGVMRTVLLAAIFAFPATLLGRRISFDAARHGGVRVGEQQFPELHAEFLEACRKLGMDRVPELYLSLEAEGRAAVAHSLLGGRSLVLVNADLIDDDWVEGVDWLAFVAAGALGAIRLGQTRWWVEILTVYSRRIPGLRTPLLVKWTRSRDRCAAYVVPDGIRGLIVEAVGKHALSSVDVPAFVEQTGRAGGLWDRLANIPRQRPSLVTRARLLYDGGFFDRERDRRRPGAPRTTS